MYMSFRKLERGSLEGGGFKGGREGEEQAIEAFQQESKEWTHWGRRGTSQGKAEARREGSKGGGTVENERMLHVCEDVVMKPTTLRL